MEGSFADAANNHGFKRARWRRLWRQQIQDLLIAVVQNVRIIIRSVMGRRFSGIQLLYRGLFADLEACCSVFRCWMTVRLATLTI
jgi:hypothetical protein